MNNNEKFNGNRSHQRRNRNRHYRKRPVKATQAATVNPENKDSENMKKFVEILTNEFFVLMEKAQACTEIVSEEILDEIPKFHQAIGAIGTLGFVFEEIDKLFPLSEYLPEEKADEIKLFFLLTVITTKRKDVMTKSIDNERWLSDGNCKLCRRSKYCSKACKANKEATQRDIYSAVNKAIGGIFAHMLEKQASLFR